MHLAQFAGANATVYFCRVFDKLFDIMNTRNTLSKNPYRKSLSCFNVGFLNNFFSETKEYILNLTDNKGTKLIHSKRKTGFLGFIINMYSIESIVMKFVIEKKYVSYLLTYKLSQDHLELFFSAIRSKGGFNNNPTALQFEEL